ncbi:MAG TPA: sialidase family protein [Acidimicrobiales bacterium]|nr:sialidase family protein [Acidimicrobiales bacterium]
MRVGRSRKRALVGACALAFTASAGYGVPVLATDGAASVSQPGADQLAGCRITTPAVAYHPGGVAVVPQPAGAPVPCLVATGFGGSEPQVVSLKDGSLVYEPAVVTPGIAGTGFLPGAPGPRPSTQFSPGGLAISRDNGATWSFNQPAGATWVPQDDALYVDRRTGRLFYYALAANPIPQAGEVPLQDQLPAGEAHLMMSPDGGGTWNEVGLVGFVESENPRFTSAPPPPGQPIPAGYRDVVYWCGNNAVNLGEPLPGYRACFRSLDGGITWNQVSILDSGPLPQHAECGSNAETFTDMDPNYPEGAPDGSLYAEVQCGSTTFLARSRDEAQTWPLVEGKSGQPVTVPANGELRVDDDGNLYLAYQDGPTSVELRVSSDGGVTWRGALDMAPPRIGPITQWAFAERGSEVAVSYLVQRGSESLYDGYLSVTLNARAADPVFWSAALNPPSDPMRTSAPPSARDDFIGVDITPSGAPWGAYAGSCPGPVASANGSACSGEQSNPEANEAVAGRLAWPDQGS